MDLSVIIVNYNVKPFLEQCLLSVERAIGSTQTEVFVVDNNSVDGSIQMVREKFPWVIAIENKDNPGFAIANNQAIKESKGRYVLLLNPDTIVEEETFSKVVNFMDHQEDAGGLGVKMYDGKGIFLPESKRSLPTPSVAFYKIFGLSSLFPNNKKFGQYHLSYLDKDKNHSVEILSGAFMLLRKSLLDIIGLLDESFFMYGEDIDLSYRVLKAGYKNYYFADTQIIHYKGESTKKGSLNYVKVFYNAMIIFAQKHFESRKQKSFILILKCAIYLRASIAVISRAIKQLGFPLLEFLMLYLFVFLIKENWEEYNHLLGKEGSYPPQFDYIAAPIYSLIFVLILAIQGGYKIPFRLKPIITTPIYGFVAIATLSYVFKEINFSRIIVGLSSMAALIMAFTNRSLFAWLQNRTMLFTENPAKKLILVGTKDTYASNSMLIRSELNYPVEVLGYISSKDESRLKSADYIGTVNKLDEVISLYKPKEIVFSSKDIKTNDIISILSKYHDQSIDFKIIPRDSDYLIGPQFIHSNTYAGSGIYNLASGEILYRKRLFDLIVSIILIALFPLSFWLYSQPLKAFKNLFCVLKGQFHLVGYIEKSPKALPKIKQGLLNMLNRASVSEKGIQYSRGLDRHYARSYSIELDLEILVKGIRVLGGSK